MLTALALVPMAQAYNRITLFELESARSRARLKTTFASNEQVRTGVDGEVTLYLWITEFQHFDPTPYVEISGVDAEGNFILNGFYFVGDGEWASSDKFARIDLVEYKGYFMAFIRQDPPRSSAGGEHAKAQPKGVDFLPFVLGGVAICGGITFVALKRDKKGRLYN